MLGVVIDGTDTSVQAVHDEVVARWHGFVDAESHVAEYEWAFGTSLDSLGGVRHGPGYEPPWHVSSVATSNGMLIARALPQMSLRL